MTAEEGALEDMLEGTTELTASEEDPQKQKRPATHVQLSEEACEDAIVVVDELCGTIDEVASDVLTEDATTTVDVFDD